MLSYISLETVRDYMTKDGYFTDLTDKGSGIWSFEVRKPSVIITSPKNSASSFKVGDILSVKAEIDKVAYAKLIVGQHTESKDNLLNLREVTFSDYILTSKDTGDLTITVEVNTGGTAIGAQTIPFTAHIQIEGLWNGGKYFVITSTNLTVREDHSTNSDEIAKFSPGDRFTIVMPKDTYDDGTRTWIKVNLDDNKTGWVAEDFVLPDEPIVTLFPESIYGNVTGNFSGAIKTENYIRKWGAPGKGSYIGANQKLNGRYKVAVAPKILNPRYPDDGKVWMDELKAFNKNITVILENISSGTSKEIECVVTDLKAHSYNKYPDGHGYTLGGTGSVNMENGFIQTGIAYPKSTNAEKDLACSKEHMNGNIVEFCSDEITDFSCADYKILKIISNEEGHI